MGGIFDGLYFAYGLLFAAILVIKYFKDRSVHRTAVALLIAGAGTLVGGSFLALLVGLGSAQGAQVVLGLFAAGSGALLVIGLVVELLGGVARPAVPSAGSPPVPSSARSPSAPAGDPGTR